jgi:catechol 2,3-dioxygenase-like lactoylglutathione lyase family enzyme
MLVKDLNPILNVSDIQQSFGWFQKLGWNKRWDWGDPPTFGSVGSGDFAIFLCQGAQGGRGKSELTTTKGSGSADKGVWMTIWVEDVDAVHRHCLEQGLEITMPPADEPWGVREMHLRHPDGHVFRITQEKEEEDHPGTEP